MPISNVCHRVGYASLPSFTTLFLSTHEALAHDRVSQWQICRSRRRGRVG
jgi:hypothetical protein